MRIMLARKSKFRATSLTAYQKDTKERVEAKAKLNKTTNEGCVLEPECLTTGKTLHQSADQ